MRADEGGAPPAEAVRYDARYALALSFIAAPGGFLFGYDWVVIGGAKPFFEQYFRLGSRAQVGWANSCALIGCLIGSAVSGGSSDRFGRKKTLIFRLFSSQPRPSSRGGLRRSRPSCVIAHSRHALIGKAISEITHRQDLQRELHPT